METGYRLIKHHHDMKPRKRFLLRNHLLLTVPESLKGGKLIIGMCDVPVKFKICIDVTAAKSCPTINISEIDISSNSNLSTLQSFIFIWIWTRTFKLFLSLLWLITYESLFTIKGLYNPTFQGNNLFLRQVCGIKHLNQMSMCGDSEITY